MLIEKKSPLEIMAWVATIAGALLAFYIYFSSLSQGGNLVLNEEDSSKEKNLLKKSEEIRTEKKIFCNLILTSLRDL